MLTFKHLEALYWVVELGGFAPAAARLHTTQSAVSKRVLDLEEHFETPLFDRTLRRARPTDKGAEMHAIAKDLLERRDTAIERFTRPEAVERRLRIGVTEVAAMTWLPALLSRISDQYPRVSVEAEADAMIPLRDKLLAGDRDLIVVPAELDDARLAREVVGEVTMAWMCQPSLLEKKTLSLDALMQQTFLEEGQRSGSGRLLNRWLKTMGQQPSRTILSSNLVTVVSMTVAGLGVSRLPQDCMRPLVEAGLLQVLKVKPVAPNVTYVVSYKKEVASTFLTSIVRLAKECCDFTRLFQTGTKDLRRRS
jgi:DNA-binding transcriptional LysR family regulator